MEVAMSKEDEKVYQSGRQLLERQLEEAQGELEEVRARADSLEGASEAQLAEATSRAGAVQQQVEALQAHAEGSGAVESMLQKELQEKDGELREVQGRLAEAEAQAREAQEELQAGREVAEQFADAMQKGVLAELESAREREETLLGELEALKEAQSKVESPAREGGDSTVRSAEYESLQNQLEEAQIELEQARAKEEALVKEAELEEVRAKEEALAKEVETLKEDEKVYQSGRQVLERQLEEAQGELEEMHSRVQTMPSPLPKGDQAHSGLDQEVVLMSPEAGGSVEQLDAPGTAERTKSQVLALTQQVHELEADAVIMWQGRELLEKKLLAAEERNEELEARVEGLHEGAVPAGAADAQELETQAKVAALEDKVATLKEDEKMYQSGRQLLEQQLEEAQGEIEEMQGKALALEQEISTLKEDESENRFGKTLLEKQLQEARTELEQAHAKESALEEEVEGLKKEDGAALQSEQALLEKQLEEAGAKAKALAEEVEALKDDVKVYQSGKMMLAKQLEEAQDELEQARAKEQAVDGEAGPASSLGDERAPQQAAEVLETQLQEVRAELEQAQGKCTALEEEMSLLRKDAAGQSAELELLEAQLAEAQQQRDSSEALLAERGALEMQQAQQRVQPPSSGPSPEGAPVQGGTVLSLGAVGQPPGMAASPGPADEDLTDLVVVHSTEGEAGQGSEFAGGSEVEAETDLRVQELESEVQQEQRREAELEEQLLAMRQREQAEEEVAGKAESELQALAAEIEELETELMIAQEVAAEEEGMESDDEEHPRVAEMQSQLEAHEERAASLQVPRLPARLSPERCRRTVHAGMQMGARSSRAGASCQRQVEEVELHGVRGSIHSLGDELARAQAKLHELRASRASRLGSHRPAASLAEQEAAEEDAWANARRGRDVFPRCYAGANSGMATAAAAGTMASPMAPMSGFKVLANAMFEGEGEGDEVQMRGNSAFEERDRDDISSDSGLSLESDASVSSPAPPPATAACSAHVEDDMSDAGDASSEAVEAAPARETLDLKAQLVASEAHVKQLEAELHQLTTRLAATSLEAEADSDVPSDSAPPQHIPFVLSPCSTDTSSLMASFTQQQRGAVDVQSPGSVESRPPPRQPTQFTRAYSNAAFEGLEVQVEETPAAGFTSEDPSEAHDELELQPVLTRGAIYDNAAFTGDEEGELEVASPVPVDAPGMHTPGAGVPPAPVGLAPSREGGAQETAVGSLEDLRRHLLDGNVPHGLQSASAHTVTHIPTPVQVQRVHSLEEEVLALQREQSARQDAVNAALAQQGQAQAELEEVWMREAALREEVDAHQEAREAQARALQEAQAQLGDARGEVLAAHEQVRCLEKENAGLEAEREQAMTEAQGQQQSAVQEMQQAQEMQAQAEAKASALETGLQETQAQLELADSEAQGARRELDEMRKVQEELEVTGAKVVRLEEEVQSLREEREALTAVAASAREVSGLSRIPTATQASKVRELEQVQASQDQVVAEMEEARVKTTALEQEVEALKEDEKSGRQLLERQLEEAQGELEEALAKEEALKKEVEALKEDEKVYQSGRQLLERQLEEAQGELEEVRARADSLEGASEAQLAEATFRAGAVQQQVEALQAHAEGSGAVESMLQKELQEKDGELREVQGRLAEAEAQAREAQEELQGLGGVHQELQTMQARGQAVEGQAKEIAELHDVLEPTQRKAQAMEQLVLAELEQTQAKALALEQEVEALKEDQKVHQAGRQLLERQLEEAQGELEEVQKALLEKDAALTAASLPSDGSHLSAAAGRAEAVPEMNVQEDAAAGGADSTLDLQHEELLADFEEVKQVYADLELEVPPAAVAAAAPEPAAPELVQMSLEEHGRRMAALAEEKAALAEEMATLAEEKAALAEEMHVTTSRMVQAEEEGVPDAARVFPVFQGSGEKEPTAEEEVLGLPELVAKLYQSQAREQALTEAVQALKEAERERIHAYTSEREELEQQLEAARAKLELAHDKEQSLAQALEAMKQDEKANLSGREMLERQLQQTQTELEASKANASVLEDMTNALKEDLATKKAGLELVEKNLEEAMLEKDGALAAASASAADAQKLLEAQAALEQAEAKEMLLTEAVAALKEGDNERIHAYTSEREELEQQLEAARAKLEQAEAKEAALETEVAALKEDLATKKAGLELMEKNLEEAMLEKDGALAAASASAADAQKLLEAQAALEQAEAKEAALETEVAALKEDLATKKADAQKLLEAQAALEQAEAKEMLLTEAVAGWRVTMSASMRTHLSEELEQQLEAARAKLEQAEAKEAALETEVAALKEDLATKKAGLELMEENLEEAMLEKDGALAAASASAADAQKLLEAQAALEQAEAKEMLLTEAVAALKEGDNERIHAYTSEREELEQQLEAARAKLEQAEAKEAALETEVAALKEDLATKKAGLELVEKNLEEAMLEKDGALAAASASAADAQKLLEAQAALEQAEAKEMLLTEAVAALKEGDNERIHAYTSEREQLEKEVAALKEDEKVHQSGRQLLEQQLEEAQSELEQSRDEAKVLEQEVEVLKKDAEVNRSGHEAAEKKLQEVLQQEAASAAASVGSIAPSPAAAPADSTAGARGTDCNNEVEEDAAAGGADSTLDLQHEELLADFEEVKQVYADLELEVPPAAVAAAAPEPAAPELVQMSLEEHGRRMAALAEEKAALAEEKAALAEEKAALAEEKAAVAEGPQGGETGALGVETVDLASFNAVETLLQSPSARGHNGMRVGSPGRRVEPSQSHAELMAQLDVAHLRVQELEVELEVLKKDEYMYHHGRELLDKQLAATYRQQNMVITLEEDKVALSKQVQVLKEELADQAVNPGSRREKMELEAAESRVRALELELEGLKEDKIGARHTIDALNQEMQEAQKRLTDRQAAMEEAKELRAQLQDALPRAEAMEVEVRRMEAELREAESVAQPVKQENQLLALALQEAHGRNEELETSVTQLKEEKEATHAGRELLETQLRETLTELEEAKAKSEAQEKQVESLKEDEKAHRSGCQVLEGQLEQAQAELEKAWAKEAALDEQLRALREDPKVHDAEQKPTWQREEVQEVRTRRYSVGTEVQAHAATGAVEATAEVVQVQRVQRVQRTPSQAVEVDKLDESRASPEAGRPVASDPAALGHVGAFLERLVARISGDAAEQAARATELETALDKLRLLEQAKSEELNELEAELLIAQEVEEEMEMESVQSGDPEQYHEQATQGIQAQLQAAQEAGSRLQQQRQGLWSELEGAKQAEQRLQEEVTQAQLALERAQQALEGDQTDSPVDMAPALLAAAPVAPHVHTGDGDANVDVVEQQQQVVDLQMKLEKAEACAEKLEVEVAELRQDKSQQGALEAAEARVQAQLAEATSRAGAVQQQVEALQAHAEGSGAVESMLQKELEEKDGELREVQGRLAEADAQAREAQEELQAGREVAEQFADAMQKGVLAELESARAREETLMGEVEALKEAQSKVESPAREGGDSTVRSAEYESLQNQLEQGQAKEEALAKEVEALKEDENVYQSGRQLLERQLEEAQGELEEARVKEEFLEKEVEALKEDEKVHQAGRQLLERQLEEAQGELEEVQKALLEKDADLTAASLPSDGSHLSAAAGRAEAVPEMNVQEDAAAGGADSTLDLQHEELLADFEEVKQVYADLELEVPPAAVAAAAPEPAAPELVQMSLEEHGRRMVALAEEKAALAGEKAALAEAQQAVSDTPRTAPGAGDALQHTVKFLAQHVRRLRDHIEAEEARMTEVQDALRELSNLEQAKGEELDELQAELMIVQEVAEEMEAVAEEGGEPAQEAAQQQRQVVSGVVAHLQAAQEAGSRLQQQRQSLESELEDGEQAEQRLQEELAQAQLALEMAQGSRAAGGDGRGSPARPSVPAITIPRPAAMDAARNEEDPARLFDPVVVDQQELQGQLAELREEVEELRGVQEALEEARLRADHMEKTVAEQQEYTSFLELQVENLKFDAAPSGEPMGTIDPPLAVILPGSPTHSGPREGSAQAQAQAQLEELQESLRTLQQEEEQLARAIRSAEEALESTQMEIGDIELQLAHEEAEDPAERAAAEPGLERAGSEEMVETDLEETREASAALRVALTSAETRAQGLDGELEDLREQEELLRMRRQLLEGEMAGVRCDIDEMGGGCSGLREAPRFEHPTESSAGAPEHATSPRRSPPRSPRQRDSEDVLRKMVRELQAERDSLAGELQQVVRDPPAERPGWPPRAPGPAVTGAAEEDDDQDDAPSVGSPIRGAPAMHCRVDDDDDDDVMQKEGESPGLPLSVAAHHMGGAGVYMEEEEEEEEGRNFCGDEEDAMDEVWGHNLEEDEDDSSSVIMFFQGGQVRTLDHLGDDDDDDDDDMNPCADDDDDDDEGIDIRGGTNPSFAMEAMRSGLPRLDVSGEEPDVSGSGNPRQPRRARSSGDGGMRSSMASISSLKALAAQQPPEEEAAAEQPHRPTSRRGRPGESSSRGDREAREVPAMTSDVEELQQLVARLKVELEERQEAHTDDLYSMDLMEQELQEARDALQQQRSGHSLTSPASDCSMRGSDDVWLDGAADSASPTEMRMTSDSHRAAGMELRRLKRKLAEAETQKAAMTIRLDAVDSERGGLRAKLAKLQEWGSSSALSTLTKARQSAAGPLMPRPPPSSGAGGGVAASGTGSDGASRGGSTAAQVETLRAEVERIQSELATMTWRAEEAEAQVEQLYMTEEALQERVELLQQCVHDLEAPAAAAAEAGSAEGASHSHASGDDNPAGQGGPSVAATTASSSGFLQLGVLEDDLDDGVNLCDDEESGEGGDEDGWMTAREHLPGEHPSEAESAQTPQEGAGAILGVKAELAAVLQRMDELEAELLCAEELYGEDSEEEAELLAELEAVKATAEKLTAEVARLEQEQVAVGSTAEVAKAEEETEEADEAGRSEEGAADCAALPGGASVDDHTAPTEAGSPADEARVAELREELRLETEMRENLSAQVELLQGEVETLQTGAQQLQQRLLVAQSELAIAEEELEVAQAGGGGQTEQEERAKEEEQAQQQQLAERMVAEAKLALQRALAVEQERDALEEELQRVRAKLQDQQQAALLAAEVSTGAAHNPAVESSLALQRRQAQSMRTTVADELQALQGATREEVAELEADLPTAVPEELSMELSRAQGEVQVAEEELEAMCSKQEVGNELRARLAERLHAALEEASGSSPPGRVPATEREEETELEMMRAAGERRCLEAAEHAQELEAQLTSTREEAVREDTQREAQQRVVAVAWRRQAVAQARIQAVAALGDSESGETGEARRGGFRVHAAATELMCDRLQDVTAYLEQVELELGAERVEAAGDDEALSAVSVAIMVGAADEGAGRRSEADEAQRCALVVALRELHARLEAEGADAAGERANARADAPSASGALEKQVQVAEEKRLAVEAELEEAMAQERANEAQQGEVRRLQRELPAAQMRAQELAAGVTELRQAELANTRRQEAVHEELEALQGAEEGTMEMKRCEELEEELGDLVAMAEEHEVMRVAAEEGLQAVVDEMQGAMAALAEAREVSQQQGAREARVAALSGELAAASATMRQLETEQAAGSMGHVKALVERTLQWMEGSTNHEPLSVEHAVKPAASQGASAEDAEEQAAAAAQLAEARRTVEELQDRVQTLQQEADAARCARDTARTELTVATGEAEGTWSVTGAPTSRSPTAYGREGGAEGASAWRADVPMGSDAEEELKRVQAVVQQLTLARIRGQRMQQAAAVRECISRAERLQLRCASQAVDRLRRDGSNDEARAEECAEELRAAEEEVQVLTESLKEAERVAAEAAAYAHVGEVEQLQLAKAQAELLQLRAQTRAAETGPPSPEPVGPARSAEQQAEEARLEALMGELDDAGSMAETAAEAAGKAELAQAEAQREMAAKTDELAELEREVLLAEEMEELDEAAEMQAKAEEAQAELERLEGQERVATQGACEARVACVDALHELQEAKRELWDTLAASTMQDVDTGATAERGDESSPGRSGAPVLAATSHTDVEQSRESQEGVLRVVNETHADVAACETDPSEQVSMDQAEVMKLKAEAAGQTAVIAELELEVARAEIHRLTDEVALFAGQAEARADMAEQLEAAQVEVQRLTGQAEARADMAEQLEAAQAEVQRLTGQAEARADMAEQLEAAQVVQRLTGQAEAHADMAEQLEAAQAEVQRLTGQAQAHADMAEHLEAAQAEVQRLTVVVMQSPRQQEAHARVKELAAQAKTAEQRQEEANLALQEAGEAVESARQTRDHLREELAAVGQELEELEDEVLMAEEMGDLDEAEAAQSKAEQRRVKLHDLEKRAEVAVEQETAAQATCADRSREAQVAEEEMQAAQEALEAAARVDVTLVSSLSPTREAGELVATAVEQAEHEGKVKPALARSRAASMQLVESLQKTPGGQLSEERIVEVIEQLQALQSESQQHQQARRHLEKELQEVHSELEEYQQALQELRHDGISFEQSKLLARIEELEQQLRVAREQGGAISAGTGDLAAVRVQVAEVEAELSESRTQHATAVVAAQRQAEQYAKEFECHLERERELSAGQAELRHEVSEARRQQYQQHSLQMPLELLTLAQQHAASALSQGGTGAAAGAAAEGSSDLVLGGELSSTPVPGELALELCNSAKELLEAAQTGEREQQGEALRAESMRCELDSALALLAAAHLEESSEEGVGKLYASSQRKHLQLLRAAQEMRLAFAQWSGHPLDASAPMAPLAAMPFTSDDARAAGSPEQPAKTDAEGVEQQPPKVKLQPVAAGASVEGSPRRDEMGFFRSASAAISSILGDDDDVEEHRLSRQNNQNLVEAGSSDLSELGGMHDLLRGVEDVSLLQLNSPRDGSHQGLADGSWLQGSNHGEAETMQSAPPEAIHTLSPPNSVLSPRGLMSPRILPGGGDETLFGSLLQGSETLDDNDLDDELLGLWPTA
ncbi:hypothetical protein CYMTET_52116 [Cymbomonas tetramitiformis]|uniref:Uncharacterized protein n=1 Tax=Cymbomonas tetramitiformis TaxID=36881 RepID=A0AAE0BLH1_9CHLO|nr:hypothetical protein CYMTET_52116 [Cymbomonas tetramitiformis]